MLLKNAQASTDAISPV